VKIVHIANFYGPNSGGIKTTLHELGKGYQKYGHEFTYIVPGTRLYFEETIYGKKITVPSYILPGSGGYQIIKRSKTVIKILKALEPDRIEVSDRLTLNKVGKFAKANGIPSVVFSHETLQGLAKRFLPLPGFIRNKLVNWHNKRLTSTFDQVITTTAFAAREFIEIKTPNLVRVPLGVDLVNFNPSKRSETLRNELLKGSKYLLVHVGRLSPEKEPQRSIETLIELRNRGFDARLVVIGTGPMWDKIRDLCLGYPVDTLGYIADRNRVSAILACADISLAPGPLETFCLAALESLASATPVIASHSSAVGEILLSDPLNPAGAVASDDCISFANAVESLCEQHSASQRARQVAEQLPWDSCVLRMLEVHGIPVVGHSTPHANINRHLKAS
jgi:alpha-1,6-mannosyltransferase